MSNHLTSHTSERDSNRIDKMSGTISKYKKWAKRTGKKVGKNMIKILKHISTRKNRMINKNPYYWDKL
jgi:hypothetical protein